MSKTFSLFTAIVCAGALTLIGAGSAFAKTAAKATTKTTAKTTTTTSYSISWQHSVYKVGASYGGFSGMSCATLNMCVGVDGAGDVIWSTTPTRAQGNAWRIASVDASGGGLTGISCPSKQLCVAVDATGEVIWSTTPNGGGSSWSTPVRIDSATEVGGSYVGLAGIACASTKLCVAVDNAPNGGLLVSRNPTGGASTWRRTTLGSGAQLTSVSCPSTTLCVVAGSETFYATTPMGVASAWHQTNTAPASGLFAAVGCVTGTTTCLTVGYGSSSSGFSYGTSKAGLSSATWTASALESIPATASGGLVDAVGCPVVGFCVAVDSVDNAFTTSTPVRGNWSAPKLLPYIVDNTSSYANSTVISCTVKICVVADSNGFVTGGNVIAKTVKKSIATSSKKTAAKKAS